MICYLLFMRTPPIVGVLVCGGTRHRSFAVKFREADRRWGLVPRQ